MDLGGQRVIADNEISHSEGGSNAAGGADRHGPSAGSHWTSRHIKAVNFSWQNVQILRFMGSIQPLELLTVATDYRLVWLADTHDSFYTNKGARRGGLASTDGTGYGINPNFSSYVGSEIDLVATYAIRRDTSLQAGVGHFFVGDYVKSSLAGIGGTRDATFAYLQFTFNF